MGLFDFKPDKQRLSFIHFYFLKLITVAEDWITDVKTLETSHKLIKRHSEISVVHSNWRSKLIH
jgi:hypothetical protein